jgi:sporulation protein YlmC with PRC-barrel domain
MLLVGSALKGYAIAASDGRIGTVSDFLFDDRTWKLRWLVVDTGTWLSGRMVLIHPSAIGQANYVRRELPVALTMARVKGSPDLLQDQPVSQQMEYHLYDYYGWDPYWGGAGYFGGGAIGEPMSPPVFAGMARSEVDEMLARSHEGDPHLRSLAAVTGYNVHASDGGIGHVEDFLIDDASWGIHYLIIDTRNWWPGAHVLLSPYAVREISWSRHEVQLDVSRERVKSSPPWNPMEAIDRAYERRLHEHYNWPGYGW